MLLGKREVVERALDGSQGRLGPPLAVDDAEVPVLDVVPAPVPLVSPGKDEGPRAPRSESAAHLPVQSAGLPGFGMAATVR